MGTALTARLMVPRCLTERMPCNMTILSMLTCLGDSEGYLIIISFDAKGYITTTFVAVWAVICDARETFLACITGIVMLLWKGSQHMIYHERKGKTNYMHLQKAADTFSLAVQVPALGMSAFCSLPNPFLNLHLRAVG
jgi:hypothetical protein